MNRAETEQPSAYGISGKVVIVGILTVALVAAGVSWWFRFHATHLAAGFWGPQTARVISSATTIKLSRINRNPEGLITTSMTRNVSNAPGITHLRTALLEDNNFVWPASRSSSPAPAAWRLEFFGDSADEVATVYFTGDLNYTFHPVSEHEVLGVSCAPISAGILELFTEMMAGPAADGPPGPAPPAEPAR
jgi:hypothetical protein